MKKNGVAVHTVEKWVIPPKADGEYVGRMEDLLDLYAKPYDAAKPVVCMDEASKQLTGEVKVPLPPTQGHPKRVDYEYRRNGAVTHVRPQHIRIPLTIR